MDTIDTAEPDEFARLLAQLNGEPEPAAAPPAEASAPVAPPAPLLPPPPAPEAAPAASPFPPQPTAIPVSPTPPEQAPPAAGFPGALAPLPIVPAAPPLAPAVPPLAAAATPVAPAVPQLAPAFGMAAPVPALVTAYPAPAPAAPPAIAFPPVAAPAPIPPAAPLPVTAPPVALAPELMGADELAAPPSASSALSPPLEPDAPPPLVAPLPVSPPPAAEAPLAAATPLGAALAATPPPLASASPVIAPAPVAAAAPPASSISSAAPPPAAPPAAPPARPGVPMDFAALLSTPVGADDAPSSAAAPLVFGAGSSDADDTEPDIGRSTLFEKIGLLLAVVVAPIGLIVGIVSAVLSVRRRGWVVGIVRASIVIGALLTVALGVGGYYEYTQYQQQLHHDQIAAESTAFCATLKADPSMYQAPTFGWPAVAASIPDSLTAMQAFEDRWTKLAKVSPAGITGDVTKEATAAKQIIDSVKVARVVDDASNIAVMTSVASSSGIPAWHNQYCG